ncbi:flagellar biosynthetic protein FliO [Thermosediminibacter litoriperuensis]|uniref:Flagellar biosynthesis protein FliO n=1 Tax=Thermosediminibacter litoriperuensis TaxID=291989 RepID=A0A5S5B0J1_9FIRM|nr:flagellar biosynthetic protein FliO [Thermosediminibacter litoriperuensis]TYP59916.1 flagellar biosynthesis protein FliO [Thermosediminibacter litoriperuensis]
MKKKYGVYALIILVVLFLGFKGSWAALGDDGDPIDVDNLKKYSFEEPGDSQQTSPWQIILKFAVYFITIVFVCILAFITTRWLARYTPYPRWKSKYMEVVDVLHLDSHNRVFIIKSPMGLQVLAASEREICLIGELDEKTAELIYEAENTGSFGNRNFGNQLDNFLNKIKSIHSIKDGDDKL